jgi:hypothetical protein
VLSDTRRPPEGHFFFLSRRFHASSVGQPEELEQAVQVALEQDAQHQSGCASARRHPPLAHVPCFHPIPAVRCEATGSVVITRKERRGEWAARAALPGYQAFELPCGRCIGCRKARARSWALRCTLELAEHEEACWATLTYDERCKPPSLRKDHLQGWLKRVRKRMGSTRVRFFASGEYGERTFRPHYHAILYGIPQDSAVPQAAWPHGHVRVDPLTPAAVSYVAGYCSKKLGWSDYDRGERVDRVTGEVYHYQPPFVQMSRRPGIGGAARAHRQSWRSFAVLDGNRMPVPRFLHAAWKDSASEAELAALELERAELRRELSYSSLMAGEAHASTLHELSAVRRTKL